MQKNRKTLSRAIVCILENAAMLGIYCAVFSSHLMYKHYGNHVLKQWEV